MFNPERRAPKAGDSPDKRVRRGIEAPETTGKTLKASGKPAKHQRRAAAPKSQPVQQKSPTPRQRLDALKAKIQQNRTPNPSQSPTPRQQLDALKARTQQKPKSNNSPRPSGPSLS